MASDTGRPVLDSGDETESDATNALIGMDHHAP
jgi:hypothetical protein